MSRIIFKYLVEKHGVIVSGEHKCIAVGLDPKTSQDLPCIWVEHASLAMSEPRVQYLIMGTGWTMEDDDSYHAGSVITPAGYVWHVYAKELP